jgi:Ca2+:H+ antiporter
MPAIVGNFVDRIEPNGTIGVPRDYVEAKSEFDGMPGCGDSFGHPLGGLAAGIFLSYRLNTIFLASLFGSLLTLALAGLVLPTTTQLLAKRIPGSIVKQSRSTAIVFIVTYFGLLYFQLRTHGAILETERYSVEKDEEEERVVCKKQLGVGGAVAVITISTTLVGFNTYLATNSLKGLLNETKLTRSFVGIALLPLFTSDLEPIMAAVHDDMDLCLQATVGKCIQTTLFVIPVVVIIGWGMGIDEMKLSFDGVDVAALFSSALYIVFLTNYGQSAW